MRKFLRPFGMIAIALVMIGSFGVPQTTQAQDRGAAATAAGGREVAPAVAATDGRAAAAASAPGSRTVAPAVAAIDDRAAAAAEAKNREVPPGDNCSFLKPSTWGVECFYGMLGNIIWFTIVPALGWVLGTIGLVTDFALNLQLGTSFFREPAIAAGWTIIRDLCNMVFIFVLIYAGIATILNLSSANLKKVITGVIISALLINFSLYITRAIIDVSNITTAWFVQGVKNVGGGVGVSDSVRKTLQMEKLISGEAKPKEGAPINYDTYLTGLALVALNLVAIYVFFNIAFLFIARIVSFMFLLVTAPIGFVKGLGIGDLDDLASKWWGELRKQAIMAPMFFLMLYLTLYIVDQIQRLVFVARGATDPVTGSSFSPANYLMFAIIIMMLLKCLEIAKENSGELGDKIAGFAKGAVSVAFGGVAGAGALAARTGVGAYFAAKDAKPGEGMKDARSAAYKTFRSAIPVWNSTTPLSQTIKNAAKEGSWDVRNIPGMGKLDKASNTIGDLVGVDMTARSAKEHKEAKDNFAKGYKTQTEIADILKQIRDIEAAKQDMSSGRITPADFTTRVSTAQSKIRAKTSKMSGKDLEAATAAVHDEAKSRSKNNTDRLNGTTTADVMQSYTDQLKSNQTSALASSADLSGSIKSAVHSARSNRLDEIFDTRPGVPPVVFIPPATRSGAIREALYGLSTTEVAKLDMSKILTNPEVAELLKVEHLKKIMEETTLSERAALRGIIAAMPTHPALTWLTTDPVGQSF
jgi:hypothetical protein